MCCWLVFHTTEIMVFSSSIFLVYFLPVLVLLYAVTPQRFRNYLLLLASILFYAWGAPRFIFVILGTTLLDFFLVREIHASHDLRRRKLFLVISVCVNLGLLAWFKYFNFFAENISALFGIKDPALEIALPLGISFYTFETITYVVDVYRGIHPPQKNFLNYLLYILFFPKMIVGPIIRYHEIAGQIEDRTATENAETRIAGFIRFCIGLGKKVLIANLIGKYVNGVFSPAFQGLSAANAWLGAIAFILHLYYDFSGYSDMAVGLGRMFGFRLPENFNNPLTAQSLTEFWQRWHITLSAWMKNYLYLPLGGNRVPFPRLLLNLWIVFLLSGFWHGASWNYLLWGAAHGFIILLERLFLLKFYKRIGRIIPMLLTVLFVSLAGVIFKTENLSHAGKYFSAMFGIAKGDYVSPAADFWLPFWLAILFAFFVLLPSGEKIQRAFFEGATRFSLRISFSLLAVFLFVLSLAFVTASGFNPFLYFRF